MNYIVSRSKILHYCLSFFIILGLVARIFLAAYMPLWVSDEGWSYWSSGWYSTKSLFFPINNPADFAHPSGYYVFLSWIRLVTDNLVMLRLTSIFFVIITMILLWKIGEKYKGPVFAKLLVFIYSFSGYFLITDWMIRGYALTTLLIVFSIYLYTIRNSVDRSKFLFILLIIHVVGLYVDYSFWWYQLALMISLMYKLTMKIYDEDGMRFILSQLGILILALIIFLQLYPDFFINMPYAREGVAWAGYYANPNYFVPYFLGSTGLNLVTFIGFLMVFLAIYVSLVKRRYLSNIIYFSAIMGLFIGLLTTHFYSPLFHVRNMLVIGLSEVFLMTEAIYWLVGRGFYLVSIIILICGVNVFVVLFFDPSAFDINVYLWRYVIPRYTHDDNEYYLVDKDRKSFFHTNSLDLPSVWDIEYTLQGRDVLFGKSQKYVVEIPDKEKCEILADPVWICS